MSSEVGSGHVSIFPVMTGFKSRVTKETKAAGAAGAKQFEGGFKGAGRSSGRALGRDLKSSLSASARDLGGAELKKFTGEVASASAALARTRLKQQDDAGRVRVAETRLAEAIAKSGAGSAQAVAAEERLASARRVHQASTDAVTAASDRLRAAQNALTAAQQANTAAAVAASGGLRQLFRDFRSGFTSAGAARSAFTGVAGSIGGILRAVSDMTGLTAFARLTRNVAQRVSSVFTSLATMIGGQLARAWSASARWLGGIGSTVRGALAPIGQYLASVGTLIASPFINLGRRVGTWLSPLTSQVAGLFSKMAGVVGPAFSRITSHVRALAGPMGSAASTAFKSVVGAAQRAGAAAGKALADGVRNVATGAVAAAGVAAGIALGKGFSRLAAIDTAQAKLRGLGNDAQSVTAIMSNAMASVRGTAFGLGEAATVAASAVAAGIKPGEALQGHLTRIANNAAAAGMSMEEMGSIFNKAATQANGVQNDVISQLADRGIPIYQALADQMGVTAGEVFKMASEGKVDFETFSKAAQSAAGTVAKEMGTTVPGATKNFFAAMGRIGANALGPIYDKLGPLIQAATSALGPIEEKAKEIGAVVGGVLAPAFDWVTNLLNRIGEGASLASLGFGGLSSVIGPLAGAFAALGAGGLAGILSRLGPLAALLPGLTSGLALLGGPLGIAAAAFAGFALSGGDVSGLVSTITGVIESVAAAIPGVVAQVVQFVPQIIDAIVSAIPTLLASAGMIVHALVDGLIGAIPMLVLGALALVNGLVAAIVTNLPFIINGAIQVVQALIQGIVTALPMLIEAALMLVTGLLTAIVSALPVIIEGGVQLLMALIEGIIAALPVLLEAALGLIMGLLGAIIENLPLIIDAGIQLLLSLVTGLIGALPQLITAAITLVMQLFAGLLKMLPKLIEAGIQLVVSLVLGLIKAIPEIIAALPEIITAIWDGLMGVDWLGLGKDIIQGIIDGFFAMVGAVGDAIGSVVGGILDFFPHSPAKRGPLGPVGWRQLKSSGAATMEQFVDGAEGMAPSFADSLAIAARSASRRTQAALVTVGTPASTQQARPGTEASRADGGAQTLIFVDADGQLISTMRGVAATEVEAGRYKAAVRFTGGGVSA